MDLDKMFAAFEQMKVAVIGDVMLDTYWWGGVDRISPEAPVPIVAVTKREKRIGGAGNVALNLVELGASVALLTVLGDDEDGVELKQLLGNHGIDTGYMLKSSNRITTNKIRIISRNQHMMRLDAEHTGDLATTDEQRLIDSIRKYIEQQHPGVVILEDYNKGVLTEGVIRHTIQLCRSRGIPVTVDPKRKNFFCYQHATLFKPNLQEVNMSLNRLPENVSLSLMEEIHEELKAKLQHSISLITLSEKGIYYHDEDQQELIPSHRRNIADVSGAGDTVISVASLVYAVTHDVGLTARISNIAGGIVCEEVGTVPVNKKKLLSESKRLLTKEVE